MAELVIKLVNGELAGKTAQTLAKEINAAALAAKKAEIGTKEWIDAHQRLKEAKELQEDLREQIESTGNASEILKNAFDRLPGAGYFNQISESFTLMKKGVGGLTSQFGVLKTAIAATGLGLLAIILATVFDWFKKTDEGATLLAGIFRGMEQVVDMLFAGFRQLGETIYAAFQNPKQLVLDLVELIKTNLINRVKAFVVIWQGVKNLDLKTITNGILQFGSGVENVIDKVKNAANNVGDFINKVVDDVSAAVKEGIALEAEFDRIADRARELGVVQAETEKIVSQLLLQSKNVSLSYEERLALLDKASAYEKKNHQEQLKNARDLEAAVGREVAMKEAVGKVTDELDQKYKDAQIARINLEKESINLQEKIENRRSQLLEKQQAEIEKALAERLKQEQEYQQAVLDALRDIEDKKLEAMEDSREKDLKALEIDLRRQLEALDSNAPFYAERVAAAQELARARRAEVNKKWDEKDVKEREKALQTAYEIEQVQLLEQLVNGEITRRRFDQQAYQNQIDFFNAKLALLQEQGQIETDQYAQILNSKLSLELAHQDRIKEARKATFDSIIELGNTLYDAEINRLNRENAASQRRLEQIKEQYGEESLAYKTAQTQIEIERKKNGERIKKFEKTKVKINLLSEIANIWLNANSFPFPYSAVIGGLLTAAAVVRANQNIKNIEAQQYADGGLLKGPGHDRGGIPAIVSSTRQPIEMEGGEFVFSRKAVAGIGVDNLSRINNHYTKRFASGGPVNPFSDRSGPASSAQTNGADGAAQQGQDLKQYIGEVVAAIDRRIDRLQVINDVSKTKEGIDTINKIRDDADV